SPISTDYQGFSTGRSIWIGRARSKDDQPRQRQPQPLEIPLARDAPLDASPQLVQHRGADADAIPRVPLGVHALEHSMATIDEVLGDAGIEQIAPHAPEPSVGRGKVPGTVSPPCAQAARVRQYRAIDPDRSNIASWRPREYMLPRFARSTTVIDSSTNREKH